MGAALPRKYFLLYAKPDQRIKQFCQRGVGARPPPPEDSFCLYAKPDTKKKFFLGRFALPPGDTPERSGVSPGGGVGVHPPRIFLCQIKTPKKFWGGCAPPPRKKDFLFIPNQDQKKRTSFWGGVGKKTLWGKSWGPPRPDVSRAGGLYSPLGGHLPTS